MKKLKFLLGALSFVAAAFTASPSQAQIKTYLSEDFSGQFSQEVWNLDSCTLISESIGPLYFVQTSDIDFWGGWIYDPDGDILKEGAPTQLDGVYEIVANPIQLERDAINMISVNYMYAAQSSGTRSFGIRVREEDSTTWTEVGQLTNMGTDKEGLLIATLDSQWSGKRVVMEVYFSAKHKANSPYYFLMGEIKFAAYAQTPEISTTLSAAPVAYGKNFDVKLSITNTGAVPVKSVEYTYTIDNNAKTGKLPADFNTALEPLTGMAGGTVQIDIDGLQTGEHTLKFRPSQINGEDVTGNNEESLVFYLVDESQLNQQYVPLFEGFTASTCTYCAPANQVFNPVLEKLQKAGAINSIKYQMNFPGAGDPYYISGNKTRMEYYDGVFGWDGYWGVPMPIYNGMEEITSWNGDYWSDLADLLLATANSDHKKKAVMDINITKAEIDATDRLTLDIEITPRISIKGKVHAIVVEKTTTKNKRTNGEKEFHNVAMKFVTNASGVEKAFEAGKKETLSYSAISLKNTKIEEMYDLAIVCFVQHESGYIFQSASTLNSGIVANENEVMGDVRVYPNPASEFVNITNLEGADVEIFDLTGRRVYANSKVEGDLEISLAAFANGTYVVRLTKDGQSAHRKLIVVK